MNGELRGLLTLIGIFVYGYGVAWAGVWLMLAEAKREKREGTER